MSKSIVFMPQDCEVYENDFAIFICRKGAVVSVHEKGSIVITNSDNHSSWTDESF